MTQTPAGWYPDPDPQAPYGSTRFWDGQRWTDQVARQPAHHQPAVQPQLSAPPSAPAYDPYAQQNPYAQQAYAPAVATTPDGAPLAGWLARAGAYLIDGLILIPLGMLAASPWLGEIGRAFADFWRESLDAAEAGRPAPSTTELTQAIGGTMLLAGLMSQLAAAVYYIGMHAWRQQTLGKMLVGIKVRQRDADRLPLGPILIRWALVYGIGLAGLLQDVHPLLGLISLPVLIFQVLDLLWPLWDDKKQALHDKAARTNVVRVR